MSKGRGLTGPLAPARRRLRPEKPSWKCYQGEGCCAEEPTRGDMHGHTHTRWHTPEDIHARRNAPTGTRGDTETHGHTIRDPHTHRKPHTGAHQDMHTTHRYQGHLQPDERRVC